MSLFSVLGYGDSSGQGWNRKHRLPRVPHDDGTESNDDDDDDDDTDDDGTDDDDDDEIDDGNERC